MLWSGEYISRKALLWTKPLSQNENKYLELAVCYSWKGSWQCYRLNTACLHHNVIRPLSVPIRFVPHSQVGSAKYDSIFFGLIEHLIYAFVSTLLRRLHKLLLIFLFMFQENLTSKTPSSSICGLSIPPAHCGCVNSVWRKHCGCAKAHKESAQLNTGQWASRRDHPGPREIPSPAFIE